MAGFEYRYNKNSAGQVAPAWEYKLEAAYANTAQANDVVKLNPAGLVVKAAVSEPGANILGVLTAKTLKRAKDVDTFGKVRTNKSLVYEAACTAGTPVVGGVYEITADAKVDASKTEFPAVKVEQVINNTLVRVSII